MTVAITKLTVGILGGTVLLLASGCATRTRAGGATDCGITNEEFVLRSVNANANMLHMKLLYLDKEDYKGLREAIDTELDGELLAICMMIKEPSSGSRHSREVSRTILGRIARYRSQRPPSYSPEHLDENNNEAGSSSATTWAALELQKCLDEALAGPRK
jgi:hypothetical protein